MNDEINDSSRMLYNKEIKKAFDYYKNDSLKKKALEFLVANMKYHYSNDTNYITNARKSLLKLYENGDCLTQRNIYDIHCVLNRDQDVVSDYKMITADFLISNIDHSFKVWKEKPWNRSLSFEDFCEYLLPYRVANEPLEDWKQMYYNKYNPILDSLYQGTDAVEAANLLNLYIAKTEKIIFNSDFKYVSPGASFYLDHKWGSCMDMRDIMLYIFRAVGIPIIADFYLTAPADTNIPHAWCSILDSSKHTVVARCPGIEIARGIMMDDPPGKVYRSYFGIQPLKYEGNEVSSFFRNRFIKDVTAEYSGKNEFEIEIGKTEHKYLYLGVQTGVRTTLIDIAPICEGKAIFHDIQKDIIYQLFYYEKGRLKEAGFPIQPKEAKIKVYKPDTSNLQNITLYRKFPQSERLLKYRNTIVGAKLEGATTSCFHDRKVLYTFKDSIVNISTLSISLPDHKQIRYLKYTAPKDKGIQIAELKFYEKENATKELSYKKKGSKESIRYRNGFLENICDGNLLTFYASLEKDAFIICDFEKYVSLKHVKITPRTDDNFIRIGDLYELFYHDGSAGWRSLGVQIATKQALDYQNVPANALLWLKNHTRGQEEQVFFIKEGKQIFIRNEVSWNYV